MTKSELVELDEYMSGLREKHKRIDRGQGVETLTFKFKRYLARKTHGEKMRNLPENAISDSISHGMWYSLNGNKGGHHWEDLVGYTLNELMQHLESLFTDGMSWANYGRGGWHLDHLRPINSFVFDSTDDDEFKECWALENLQPLWEADNIRKRDHISEEFGNTYWQILLKQFEREKKQ